MRCVSAVWPGGIVTVFEGIFTPATALPSCVTAYFSSTVHGVLRMFCTRLKISSLLAGTSGTTSVCTTCTAGTAHSHTSASPHMKFSFEGG